MKYQDYERLEMYKPVGLNKEAYDLIKAEKQRLKKEEKRKASLAKIVCNLILEKYGK